MMAIEMRVSDLDIGKSLGEIEYDALTELIQTNPAGIRNQLE